MGLYDRDYMRADARQRETGKPKRASRLPVWAVILGLIVVAAILLRSC